MVKFFTGRVLCYTSCDFSLFT